MADENDPKQMIDLKARLGLQNKLDKLASGRKSSDARKPNKPVDPSDIQQPPRPQASTIDTSGQSYGALDLDAEPVSKSPKSVIIIACTVLALVVLGAGYVIGKAFQMRDLYNVQIDNAAKVHDIVFLRTPNHVEMKRALLVSAELKAALERNNKVDEALIKAKETLGKTLKHPALSAAPDVQATIKSFLDAPELTGTPNPSAIQKRTDAFLNELAEKSTNVALMQSFFNQATAFNTSIETLLADEKLKPEEKTQKLFEDFETFLQKVAAYRAYNIRFPLRDIARKDFYFVTVVPDIARMDALAVKLNSVAEAMVQDESVFQFIQKSRAARSDASDQFSRLFWIKGNKSQNQYDNGKLILKLYQKEKLSRRQMGQAVALQEKPDDPILIPIGEIAQVSLGSTIKPYVESFENTVRGRMLGNQRARLKMILGLSETFGVQGLKQKVDEYRNRAPYFVL